MKRLLDISIIALIALFSCIALACAEETMLKQGDEGKWLIYNTNRELVGNVLKTEDGGYRIESAAGMFGGKIWSNGNWNPPGAWRGRRVVVTPEAAQLYLDALKALKSGKLI